MHKSQLNESGSSTQLGFAALPVLLAIFVTFGVTFVGITVYSTQKSKQSEERIASEIESAKNDANQKSLQLNEKEVESSEGDEKIVVDSQNEVVAQSTAPKPVPSTSKPSTTTDKDKAQVKELAILSTNISVQAGGVTFSANLPVDTNGTCKVLVKRPDGSNAQWFDTSFSGTSCTINVELAKLGSGEWKAYMYYSTADNTTKGQADPKSFSLGV